MMKIKHNWIMDNVDVEGSFENFYFEFIKEKIKNKQRNKNNKFKEYLKHNEFEKLKELLFMPLDDLKSDNYFYLLFEIFNLKINIEANKNNQLNIDSYSNLQKFMIYILSEKDIDIFEKIKNYSECLTTLFGSLQNIEDSYKNLTDFLNTMSGCIEINLEMINTNLCNLEESIEAIIKYIDISSEVKSEEPFNTLINKYSNSKSYSIFTIRDEILNIINIKVCPYCNRNYVDCIFDSQKEEDIRSTGELDHFYNQNSYPFLALSLYNFVPSCKTCNSKFKLTVNDIILNPYASEFGDECKFTVNHLTVDSLLGIENNHKIKLTGNITKFKNNIDNFRLEDIYSNHFYEVKAIYDKNQKYPKQYIEDIANIIKNGTMNDYNGIKEFIYGIPKEEEFINIPLAKFKSDIYDEMIEKSD